MRKEIEKRLKEASTVCLLTDLWCNSQSKDLIGLFAVLTNPSFDRDIFVIDFILIPGKKHTAENIKEAIETMVN